MTFDLYPGDCLATLQLLDDASVDSIVTDPPYGLSFMGKRWDYDVPSEAIWSECLRVLKPGGHLLAFAGTRTQHRMAVRIEDAGFEIRDLIAWVYGSGFPKSLDVSKAIDKAAGAEREVVGLKRYGDGQTYQGGEAAARTGGGIMGEAAARGPSVETAPATDAARQWQGWGTALKPALEPITVARKPLIGTVAENVLGWGTGAINVDGCRVDSGESTRRSNSAEMGYHGGNLASEYQTGSDAGRWPANLIHDGSDEVLAGFPVAPGQMAKASTSDTQRDGQNVYGAMVRGSNGQEPRADSGSAARFFYCAKASKADRNAGCESMPLTNNMRVNGPRASEADKHATLHNNSHPTVKPTDLMRYLCRLVTPPGGVVLDPFMGSGSTGKAAMLEGLRFIGCEMSPEYMAIARARISAALLEALV